MNGPTTPDVEMAVTQLARACKCLGLPSTFVLQPGSPTNGRAWRLFTPDYSGAIGTGDRGYIGWSAQEAHGTLSTISSTLWTVLGSGAYYVTRDDS